MSNYFCQRAILQIFLFVLIWSGFYLTRLVSEKHNANFYIEARHLVANLSTTTNNG